MMPFMRMKATVHEGCSSSRTQADNMFATAWRHANGTDHLPLAHPGDVSSAVPAAIRLLRFAAHPPN
jgi:hypothetical protein